MTHPTPPLRRYGPILGTLLLAPLALTAVGCGKKGPPHPPVKVRPESISDLDIEQRGHALTIRFTLPINTSTGVKLRGVTDADVLKLKQQEPVVEPGSENAPRDRFMATQDFLKDADVFTKVERADFSRFLVDGRIEVTDDLVGEPLGGEAPNRFYYGVRVRDTEGRASLISNVESIVPLEPPLPPIDLTGSFDGSKLTLDWEPPSSGPTPAGYNVYKLVEGSAAKVLTGAPTKETRYNDYPTESTVTYLVRSSATSTKPFVESQDGARVTVSRKDTIAPDTPAHVRASAGQGRIEVYWDKSGAPDLDGYLVYRAESSSGPFAKLTGKPTSESVYLDGRTTPGTTYSYQVSAIDKSGNESDRSPSVSARR